MVVADVQVIVSTLYWAVAPCWDMLNSETKVDVTTV